MAAHQCQRLTKRYKLDTKSPDVRLFDHQSPARREHAQQLTCRAAMIAKMVKAVDGDNALERAIAERQPLRRP